MRRSGGKVMVSCICDGLLFSSTSVSIYHKHLSDLRVKSYGRSNVRGHSIWTIERHDLLWGSIGHSSQNFCPSEFLESSLLNSECLNKFPALCGDPEEWLLPFVLAMGFIFQQRASQYIININHTPVSKVMAVWILRGHSISTFVRRDILWASIGHPSQKFCSWEFVWAFLVKFWVPR